MACLLKECVCTKYGKQEWTGCPFYMKEIQMPTCGFCIKNVGTACSNHKEAAACPFNMKEVAAQAQIKGDLKVNGPLHVPAIPLQYDLDQRKSERRQEDRRDPLSIQIGGDHYKTMGIQPVEFIRANNIGYFEGNVIKYVSRHQSKGGVQDLKKARHYLDMLIEWEEKKAQVKSGSGQI